MRHNILSSQSMSFFLIIICLAEFPECQDICKQPEWTTLENVTFENNYYRYSQHYMYLQRISIDPFYSLTSVSLDKYTHPFTVKPQLSFKYYSSQVEYLTIAPGKSIIFFELEL
ncbi:unnamed protein product [Schistosoma curassoni]|nr:unnamed protein product [Schistosoma curassoni]